MAKLTVTEALQEIKTITSRISKKHDGVMRYFSRDSRLKDPLEQEGGTKEFVRRERQGIRDLEERTVAIRSAIQAANLTTSLTIGSVCRSVAAWLNWRRDVSVRSKGFLDKMASGLTQVRAQAVRQGQTVTDKDGGSPTDVIVSVNETELSKEIEEFENILGTLDGKLSLLNATMTIEV